MLMKEQFYLTSTPRTWGKCEKVVRGQEQSEWKEGRLTPQRGVG